ncbi:MAG TPA: succinate dehydrogenase/fumarate reductase iron-sulfur subunit [Candidatus Dormibacteraeota bacterium]
MKVTTTRFDPAQDKKPRRQTYEVPYQEDHVVLDALNYIKTNIDGSLSYRWSCRMGICGSCGMMVNGEPKLTCAAFLRDYGRELTVEPLANFAIIRDLVVDIDPFLEKLQSVKPWVVNEAGSPLGGGEHRVLTEETDQFRQYSLCINCMLCYSACPVYGHTPEFLGPAAIALARRYDLDPRDHGNAERKAVVRSSEGIWECSFVGECSAVCPKGVDPAKAIQQSKFDSTLGYLMPFGKRV